jgi:hypothetical protein
MVDTQNQFSLAKFQDSIGVVTTRSMKPLGKEQTALCRNLNNSSINGGFRGGEFSVRSAG